MRLRSLRLVRGIAAVSLAAGLWSCASAPPPPPPAPEPAPAAEPAPAPQAAEISWLAPKTVNVRESASTKATTLATLKKGARVTSFEEKDGWLHVKLADKRIGWVRKDLLKKDDGCLPDRKEVLIEPPMLRVTDAPGPKGKVVVEADVDETGSVKAVRVVTNETGSDERAESVKAEVKTVKFQPPVRHCKVSGFTYVYSKTF
jgi:SH3-like domain-containing protein